LEAFSTAKALASPGPITAQHLLLALEAGDTVAARAFKKLGILPSVLLGRMPPKELSQEGELYNEDFDPALGRDFPGLAFAEAESLGWAYLGTDALLLVLARVGVPGIDLPYARIREIVCEVRETA
jgi:hypothetical protein